jgi:hypothetical protein
MQTAIQKLQFSVADPMHVTLTNTVYDVIYENILKCLKLHSCITRLFCCNKTRHLISCTFHEEINIPIYYLDSVTCLF